LFPSLFFFLFSPLPISSLTPYPVFDGACLTHCRVRVLIWVGVVWLVVYESVLVLLVNVMMSVVPFPVSVCDCFCPPPVMEDRVCLRR